MEEMPQHVIAWVSDPVVISVFSIVLGTVAANYFARKVLDRLEKKATETVNVWDDALVKSIRVPFSLLIFVLGIAWAAEVLSHESDTGLAEMIDPVRYICIVGLMALFMVRFIRESERGFIVRGADVTTAQAIGKLLRVSVLITAVLTVMQTLGISISGILAFGGIGGIAVGFAAKDLLANFFGGLMIYLDRPFAVGDWVRSPDREIEGTVEHIGWRLTVIRTFDRRPLYVPNSVFASIALENPSRMQNRRIKETIGIRYDDIAQMKPIVDEVRQMLIDHPDIEADQRTLIVNFNAFNASSVDFFIYTFTKTTSWTEFHHIKERVLLTVSDIIEKHGAEIAFPTRTLHVNSIPDAEPEGN
jgi:MscS family membrane protein